MKYSITILLGGLLLLTLSCEKNVMEEPDKPDKMDCNDYSFVTDIQPIIDGKCIQCHDGSVQTPDLRTYQGVKNNAAKVKDLTAARIMPKQGSLSSQQIEMIGCWVEKGAKDN